MAENDPDEQQKFIRYNDVLASAVILQNVIDMSKIIADLKTEGWSISDEDLTFLSPYLTSGVKRFGEYGLDSIAISIPRFRTSCTAAVLPPYGTRSKN